MTSVAAVYDRRTGPAGCLLQNTRLEASVTQCRIPANYESVDSTPFVMSSEVEESLTFPLLRMVRDVSTSLDMTKIALDHAMVAFVGARAFLKADRLTNCSDLKLSQIAIRRDQHARVRVLWRPNFRIGRTK